MKVLRSLIGHNLNMYNTQTFIMDVYCLLPNWRIY